MIICEICKTELKNNIALGLHVKKHNMNSKQYYDTYMKKPNEGICPTCGKATNWWSLDKGYMQHCSCKCTQNDPNVIKKREEHFTNKYGEGITNPFQAEEVKEAIKQTNLSRHGYEHTLQRPEIIAQGRKTKELLYGDANYNNAAKALQTCFNKYGTNSFNASHNTSQSKQEIILQSIVRKYYNGPIYPTSYKVIFPQELDLYLPELRLAFEYNGSYWHSSKAGKPNDYHYKKSIKCYNANIRLIHFYEFEDWIYIENFIKAIFTNTESPTNDFNKYSPLMFNTKKVEFSGPQLLQDNIYGSGTFTLL